MRNSGNGDVIIMQYSDFLYKESRDDSFEIFDYTSSDARVSKVVRDLPNAPVALTRTGTC